MSAQLTLFVYLVASTLAIAYACVRGLTLARRVAVCALALVLEIICGLLMLSPNLDLAYAVGIPCLLALGLLMTAPRRRPARPAAPKPAPHPAFARQLGRRPSTGAPLPVLADPWAALYASMAGHVAYTSPEPPPNPGRRATDRPVAARRVAARSRHRSQPLPPSLRRASRCKPR